MNFVEEKILKEARVEDGAVLKVDSFLNHQIDVDFLNQIGKRFKELFEGEKIDKIVTIEASGIAIACICAQYFNVPVVFAKKTESKNLDKETYKSQVYSYTKAKHYNIMISKRYLSEGESILFVDDFLANGMAAVAIKDIIDQAGAKLAGVGIVIEKGFQEGGDELRAKGINLKSLAIIDKMDKGCISFR